MTASLPAGLAAQPLPPLPVATESHRERGATLRGAWASQDEASYGIRDPGAHRERRELLTQRAAFLNGTLIKSRENLNRLPFTRKESFKDKCWGDGV